MTGPETLIQMMTGHWVSRTVHAMASLGLADQLAEGPKPAGAIAGAVGADASALHRLMRTLAGLGLLAEDGERRFALTPMGALLRSGIPGSMRSMVLTLAGEWNSRSWEQLPYSIRTGKPGFDKVFGMPAFDWLAAHPVEASQFSETMVGFHGAEPVAVAGAYDFSSFRTIVDVGGATGNLIAAILARWPGPRGILFDLPHVVREAPPLLQSRGVADRVTILPGSFFETIPAGGDAYLMSHVIHDWSEEQCLAILGRCRQAMAPGARLLLIEMVLPPGNDPHPGKLLDLMMLVGPGGQERTEAEYAGLLARAGLRLTRVVPTPSAVSVVEAVAPPGA